MKSLFRRKRKAILMSFVSDIGVIVNSTRCKVKNPDKYQSISFKNNNAQKVNYAQIVF